MNCKQNQKINQIWRDAKLRAVEMKRATTLCGTVKRSIGLKKGSTAAKYEMKLSKRQIRCT